MSIKVHKASHVVIDIDDLIYIGFPIDSGGNMEWFVDTTLTNPDGPSTYRDVDPDTGTMLSAIMYDKLT